MVCWGLLLLMMGLVVGVVSVVAATTMGTGARGWVVGVCGIDGAATAGEVVVVGAMVMALFGAASSRV